MIFLKNIWNGATIKKACNEEAESKKILKPFLEILKQIVHDR